MNLFLQLSRQRKNPKFHRWEITHNSHIEFLVQMNKLAEQALAINLSWKEIAINDFTINQMDFSLKFLIRIRISHSHGPIADYCHYPFKGPFMRKLQEKALGLSNWLAIPQAL